MGGDNSKQAKSPQEEVTIWVNSKYTVEELKQWHASFVCAHPQKFITVEEFIETYHSHYPSGNATLFAQNLFRLFDLDSDGRIDFRELAIVFGSLSTGSPDEKMSWMFSLYDIDGDGFIKKREMRTILKSLLSLVTKAKFLKNVDSEVEERVDEIYAKLDQNSDGLLSRQEFMQLGNTNTVLMDVFEMGVTQIPKLN